MKTNRQRSAQLRRLAAMKDEDINTSDIPEVTDWSAVRTGQFYRPIKKQITLRIDADVLAWFKSHGEKYQTEINRILREHAFKPSKGVRARQRRVKSGEICPESGIWSVVGAPSSSVAVSKGNRMPPYEGRSVAWLRLKAA
jgi:uncharacterized protein (DUF4415 family)